MIASGLAAGVVWMPPAGVRRLAGLPPDVLSGHAGIALVFARLFAVTRDARYREVAQRALGPVRRAVAAPAQAWGMHVGRGGQLHALRVGARLLEDPAVAAPPGGGRGLVPAAATPLAAALDAGDHEAAVALAAEAVGRHDATGSWSPDPRIPDRFNPCAVTGLGALALAFLRLARGGGGLFAPAWL
jgi:hypothetical protein